MDKKQLYEKYQQAKELLRVDDYAIPVLDWLYYTEAELNIDSTQLQNLNDYLNIIDHLPEVQADMFVETILVMIGAK